MKEKELIECKICGKECKSSKALLTHIQMCHKNYNSKKYYDEFIRKENEGFCKSCGNQTTYRGFSKGYAKYCPKQGCNNYDPDCVERISKSNSITHSKPEYKKHLREVWENKSEKEIEEIVNKRKSTSIKNWGVDNPSKNKDVQQKSMETRLKNRPNDPTNIQKRLNTLQERYNCRHNWARGVLRDKEVEHWIELWGVDNCMKVPEYCEKQHESYAKNHNGARTRWQIPELQKIDSEKGNSHEARKKAVQTAAKNGKRSSYEVFLENFLIQNKISFEVEYNKDSRYPFLCDFYLNDFDIFIEIHGYWMHNNHFFNKHDTNDINILEEWKTKAITDNMYKSAIDIWTVKDVLKRNTAIRNNLNYVVLWTMEDVKMFCATFKEVYLENK